MLKMLIGSTIATTLISSSVLANGLSEAGSWQFRSPSDRQVLFSGEQIRLNFRNSEQQGIAAGLGGQTGNSLSVVISGDGNNTIDTGQDNTGDQTIQEASGTANNEITSDPSDAIAAAAARLESMQGQAN